MSDENKWAVFVKAHRLSRNLNQSEFAQAIGVSQQTVSRWESGMQIPDATIQGKLKGHIGTTALGSVTFWKHRVTRSRGHEILIDRELTVLASSNLAWPPQLYGDRQIVGAKLFDLVPGPLVQHLNTSGEQSVRQLQDMGFFDGLIRGVHMEIELSSPTFCQAGRMDIWPVLTAEQSIIGHIVGFPVEVPRPSDGFLGFRVRKSDVQLNKDVSA